MHRKQYLYVLILTCNSSYRPKDLTKWSSEILSAMASNEYEPLIFPQLHRQCVFLLCYRQQSVYNGIPSYIDVLLFDTLSNQIITSF